MLAFSAPVTYIPQQHAAAALQNPDYSLHVDASDVLLSLY